MPEHVDDVAEGDAAVVDGVEGLEGGYFSGFIEGREEVSGPRGGEDREGGVGGVGGGEEPEATSTCYRVCTLLPPSLMSTRWPYFGSLGTA